MKTTSKVTITASALKAGSRRKTPQPSSHHFSRLVSARLIVLVPPVSIWRDHRKPCGLDHHAILTDDLLELLQQ